MTAFEEIEGIQAALDQAYARLIELRRDRDLEDLEQLHQRAEETLAGARALVQMLEELTEANKGTPDF
jgi:hypothetical protein